MTGRERDSGDVTTRAALEAGRNAARRAVEDLLNSDEEKAQREAERAQLSKRRKKRLLAFALVGLLLVAGLVGLVVSYWQWFLLAGVVGLVALYGWYRIRRRFRRRSEPASSDAEAQEAQSATKRRVASEPSPDAHAKQQESESLRGERLRQERERDARAREEASALERQEIEDELAAMKARLDD